MFITFEGIEGSGKTTQADRLVRRLLGLGVDVVRTLEPGGTRLGRQVRRILLDARNRDLLPLCELLLYEADRAQHVEEVIRPALERGQWVVCDRFYDATTVYQGYARGLDKAFIRFLNEHVCAGIAPDLTFLHDCPVETGLARALRRNQRTPHNGQDRFERERIVFHEAVRKGYLELAEGEPGRFVVIDAERDEAEIEAEIFARIRPHLPGQGT
ncbi:MAG: dTMP kinase [Deltaproteobacteria bacterium]|nr:dTMP kinase [Deltaproteobacteria bacterium]MBW2104079.1 dTMP kinase [Deltaproteobacteria bacterium]